jgi:hypothetical protein
MMQWFLVRWVREIACRLLITTTTNKKWETKVPAKIAYRSDRVRNSKERIDSKDIVNIVPMLLETV